MRGARSLTVLASLAVMSAGCGTSSPPGPGLSEALETLEQKLATVRTVCYSPTVYDPLAVPPVFPSTADIA